MAHRCMNEEEIFDFLTNYYDIEDENESPDNELIEYDVEKVQGKDFVDEERSDVPDCAEDLEDIIDLELPVITEANLSAMGLSVDNELPSSSQFSLTCTEKKHISWRKNRTAHSSTAFIYEPTHVAEDLEIATPYAYFKKYLTDEFFVKTAHYTNLYAQQKGQLNFEPCSVNEVRIVFAHHIMMGNLKFPRVEMFYNSSIGMSFFTDYMTRKRFFSIRSNLHLVDVMETRVGNTDRLYKVQPIIAAVKNRLLSLPLEENLCIDEQIIPFKGKFAAKQYIKGKPTPWGIKVFLLCGKSGIPYDLIVYQGSTTPIDQAVTKTVGFGSAVVLQLCQRIPTTTIGHNLFFDNYFPSYQLFEVLKQRKINAAGTIRVNRFANPKLPTEKEMKASGRGSSAECVDANNVVVLTRWYDNKVVNMGSNFVGIGDKDKAKRWEKDSKEFISIDRPQVVRMYNESMGGVDLLDQMIQYYRINIRSVKWTLRVIMHFVDLALTAAWMEYKRDCIYKKIPKKNIKDSLNFRIAVAKTLVFAEQENTQPEITRKRGRPSKSKTLGTIRKDLSSESDTESCDSSESSENQTKRKKIFQKQPPSEVRLDQIRHLPEFVNVKSAGRCKNKNCGKSSFIICQKCKVYLFYMRKT